MLHDGPSFFRLLIIVVLCEASSDEPAQFTNDAESRNNLQLRRLVNEAFDVLARFTSGTRTEDQEERRRLLFEGKWFQLFDQGGASQNFVDQRGELRPPEPIDS